MKLLIKRLFFLFITLILFSFFQDDKRVYILENVDLNENSWVITLGKTADISRDFGDTVRVITDIEKLKENKYKFSIINDKRCINTTPPFRITIYKDGHNYSRKYYCFPEQLNLGSLEGCTDSMLLNRLITNNIEDYTNKKDSLLECGDLILLSIERENDYLIKHLSKLK